MIIVLNGGWTDSGSRATRGFAAEAGYPDNTGTATLIPEPSGPNALPTVPYLLAGYGTAFPATRTAYANWCNTIALGEYAVPTYASMAILDDEQPPLFDQLSLTNPAGATAWLTAGRSPSDYDVTFEAWATAAAAGVRDARPGVHVGRFGWPFTGHIASRVQCRAWNDATVWHDAVFDIAVPGTYMPALIVPFVAGGYDASAGLWTRRYAADFWAWNGVEVRRTSRRPVVWPVTRTAILTSGAVGGQPLNDDIQIMAAGTRSDFFVYWENSGQTTQQFDPDENDRRRTTSWIRTAT